MGKLIKFELEKLIRKKLVLISLAALSIALFFWATRLSDSYMVVRDGEILTGKDAIRYDQSIIARYRGPLTDEKVHQAFQEYETGENHQNSVQSCLYYVFGTDDGNWNGKTVKDTFPTLKEPPVLGDTKGFEAFSISYASFTMFAGLLILIAVSPIFSEECVLHMDGLLLSTRHGKRKAMWAKVAASLIFTLALMILLAIVMLAACRSVFDMSDGQCSILLSPKVMFSEMPLDMSANAAIGYTLLTCMTAMVLLTLLTVIVSVLCRSSYLSLIVSAALYFVPIGISFLVENEFFLKLISLTPGVLSNTHQVLELSGTLLPWIGFGIMCALLLCIWHGTSRLVSTHQVQ